MPDTVVTRGADWKVRFEWSDRRYLHAERQTPASVFVTVHRWPNGGFPMSPLRTHHRPFLGRQRAFGDIAVLGGRPAFRRAKSKVPSRGVYARTRALEAPRNGTERHGAS